MLKSTGKSKEHTADILICMRGENGNLGKNLGCEKMSKRNEKIRSKKSSKNKFKSEVKKMGQDRVVMSRLYEW
jgi:hypothetical protein